MSDNPADKATTPSDPVFRFFNELGIIEQLSTTHLERVLPGGLTKAQFGVLNHMVRLGKKESPAELANAFQVSRPTMTNTIQKLEAKGYVEVIAHPSDGRSKIVLITEQGVAIRGEGLRVLAPLFEQIGTVLGADSFAAAAPFLEKVRTYLDENR